MKVCLNCHSRIESDTWNCLRCGWRPDCIDGFMSFVNHNDRTASGFEAEYFPVLFDIERNHFWFRSRNRLIIWILKRFFPNIRNFIEIGCGTGFVLHAIQAAVPQLRVAGSELFAEGLVFARQRVPKALLFQMDAENIPFVDEFDLLGVFDVLEHIADDRQVLRQFFAAIKEGGGIILTVPQHPALWSGFDEKSRHVRRYTRNELLEKISAAGFKTVFISSFVTFLLPFMIASRWKSSSDADPKEEVESARIPTLLNYVFELVLTFELILIRIGVSLPIGGSLVVVAKKQ